MSELEVTLDEVDDMSPSGLADADSVKYPCIVIGGVTSEEEVKYFRNREVDEASSLPMYCLVEGIPLGLGGLELSLVSLLALRTLFPYKVTLYRSVNDSVEIDLNDANTLVKFIKL